jgi:hypothetical protein
MALEYILNLNISFVGVFISLHVFKTRLHARCGSSPARSEAFSARPYFQRVHPPEEPHPDYLRNLSRSQKKLPVKEKWPFGAGKGCSGRATLGFHQT